jgi:hypothetical protein
LRDLQAWAGEFVTVAGPSGGIGNRPRRTCGSPRCLPGRSHERLAADACEGETAVRCGRFKTVADALLRPAKTGGDQAACAGSVTRGFLLDRPRNPLGHEEFASVP